MRARWTKNLGCLPPAPDAGSGSTRSILRGSPGGPAGFHQAKSRFSQPTGCFGSIVASSVVVYSLVQEELPVPGREPRPVPHVNVICKPRVIARYCLGEFVPQSPNFRETLEIA